MSKWKSNAQWPEGTCPACDPPDFTYDYHGTFEGAKAVCELLRRKGFGGDNNTFPLRTWIEDPTGKIIPT